MFVGGFLACILDNTIPGTRSPFNIYDINFRHFYELWYGIDAEYTGTLEERGIVSHRHVTSAQEAAKSRSIYDLPFGLTRLLNRPQFSQWLPFLPTHNDATQ